MGFTMDAREGIRLSIDLANMVCNAYLGDLTHEEMMKRPHAGCNHLIWQVGHLVASEHNIVDKVAPGHMPALPDGFTDKYTSETTHSDNAADFHSKDELMALSAACREGTLKALAAMSDEQLAGPAPEEMQSYAPTVAAALSMQGSHWLMHCGQWVILRRELGKPIVI